MSSSQIPLQSAVRSPRAIILTAFAGLMLLAIALLSLSAPVGAQSVYGGDSVYGTEVYSAEGKDADRLVGAPNTGFQSVIATLERSPGLLWGGSVALLVAALIITIIIKRKQEN